jgi:hypothetical protein
MSNCSSLVESFLEAFAGKMRTNNPKTNPLRLRREALLRHSDQRTIRRRLVRGFVRNAVEQFGEGNWSEGRRFYDGAFAFGSQLAIRTELLKSCVAAAIRAYNTGDYKKACRLMDVCIAYPPGDISDQEVLGEFARAGIPVYEIEPPETEEPHWRFQRLKRALLVPALA